MADDLTIDSVIMEIRAGTGGEEAALFARALYTMYVKYAEVRKWKVEQRDFSPAEMGGFREAICSVTGPGVWAELGYEVGGHRVQRVPQTESQGRIHTSAATVAVLPEPEELDIQINPDDVVEHVSRAGGPGGQNVNKVATAVQLRFDVADSPSLPDAVKRRLLRIAGAKVTSRGVLVIDARRHRTQKANRQDAVRRLVELVRKAAAPPKNRRTPAPTAASRQRRLKAKRRRRDTKKLRRPPDTDSQ